MSLSTQVAALSSPTLGSILGAAGLGGFGSQQAGEGGFFPAFSPIADYDTLNQDEDLSGGGVTNINAFWFRPNGLQLFTIQQSNDTLTEWSLSTAYLLSTATFVQSVALNAALLANSMQFSPDGTVLFAVTQATGIQSYVLGTAWDITTLGAANFFNSGDGDNIQGITVASDGSRTVTGNGDSTNWFESDMSTAFDLTSASVGSQQAQSEASSVNGIFMHGGGTKFYMFERGVGTIHEYDITDFDITTRALNATGIDMETPQGWTNVSQFQFNPDGSEIFVLEDAVSLSLASYIT